MSQPQIEYPCEWTYTIIGADEAALRAAAEQVLAGKTFSIEFSRKSKAGKYVSLSVTTNVQSEDERNAVCQKFSGNAAIKIVI